MWRAPTRCSSERPDFSHLLFLINNSLAKRIISIQDKQQLWGQVVIDATTIKHTCSPSVKILVSKLQEMAGVGSPEASQVSVMCSSNSEAVSFFR